MSADLIVVTMDKKKRPNFVGHALSGERGVWAFRGWKRNLHAVQPGTIVAFFAIGTLGDAFSRSTQKADEWRLSRLTLGRVDSAIRRVDEDQDRHYSGWPYEFTFAEVRDLDDVPESQSGIDGMVALVNDYDEIVGLDRASLREAILNSASAPMGIIGNGRVLSADDFPRPEPDWSSVPMSEAPSTEQRPKPPTDPGSVGVAIGRFARDVHDSGSEFHSRSAGLPAAFLSALVAKRFAILSGLSGSGKTQLAIGLGQWLGEDDKGRPRYSLVPVRPDWTSPEPLLGYEDALRPVPNGETRRAWTVPDPLRFILRAATDERHLYVLILDEMNLAHVERYFADVLSGMESGEPILPDLEEVDGAWFQRGEDMLPWPANLYLVGTVNIDETTYQFSPKVLDRAFSFEFRVASEDLGKTDGELSSVASAAEQDVATLLAASTDDHWHLDHPSGERKKIEGGLVELHEQLGKGGFEFGHRTYREALRFAAIMSAAGVDDPSEILDWITITKLMPKLTGSRGQLEQVLIGLAGPSTEGEITKDATRTEDKAARMLRRLRANHFVSFAE